MWFYPLRQFSSSRRKITCFHFFGFLITFIIHGFKLHMNLSLKKKMYFSLSKWKFTVFLEFSCEMFSILDTNQVHFLIRCILVIWHKLSCILFIWNNMLIVLWLSVYCKLRHPIAFFFLRLNTNSSAPEKSDISHLPDIWFAKSVHEATVTEIPKEKQNYQTGKITFLFI